MCCCHQIKSWEERERDFVIYSCLLAFSLLLNWIRFTGIAFIDRCSRGNLVTKALIIRCHYSSWGVQEEGIPVTSFMRTWFLQSGCDSFISFSWKHSFLCFCSLAQQEFLSLLFYFLFLSSFLLLLNPFLHCILCRIRWFACSFQDKDPSSYSWCWLIQLLSRWQCLDRCIECKDWMIVWMIL